MANLYGVANAPGQFFAANTIGGANVACPPNVFTPIITTGTIIAPSNGYFFVMVWLTLEVAFGATVPTDLQIGCQIGAGSNGNTAGPSASFTPNVTQQIVSVTATATSQVAWQPPGSTVTVNLRPGAQAVTVNNAGTWMFFVPFRAPDQ